MTKATEILRNAGYALVAEGDVLPHVFSAIARVADLRLVDGADEVFYAAVKAIAEPKLAFGCLGVEPTSEELAAGAHEAVATGRPFAHLSGLCQLWADADGRRAIARVLSAARLEVFEGDFAYEATILQRIVAVDHRVADMRTAAAVTMATLAFAA